MKPSQIQTDDHAWVLLNGEAVYHGTFAQCRTYVALLNFGPLDVVQLQFVERD